MSGRRTSRDPASTRRRRSRTRPTGKATSSGCRRRESARFRHERTRFAELRFLQGSRGTPGGSLAVGVIDTLRLTAEEAAGLIERGDASAGELHAAYRAAIDERDPEIHAFLTTLDEAERD